MSKWKKPKVLKASETLRQLADALREVSKLYVELEAKRIKHLAEAYKTINENTHKDKQ